MSSKHPKPRPPQPAPRPTTEPAPVSHGWRTASPPPPSVQQTTVIGQVWQGDVPSPQDMRAFREVDERFPDFFMDRVTAEQTWRHGRTDRVDRVQARVLYSREARAWAALLAGGAFLSVCLAIAYFAFERGNTLAAGLFMSPPVLVLVRQLMQPRKDDDDRQTPRA